MFENGLRITDIVRALPPGPCKKSGRRLGTFCPWYRKSSLHPEYLPGPSSIHQLALPLNSNGQGCDLLRVNLPPADSARIPLDPSCLTQHSVTTHTSNSDRPAHSRRSFCADGEHRSLQVPEPLGLEPTLSLVVLSHRRLIYHLEVDSVSFHRQATTVNA